MNRRLQIRRSLEIYISPRRLRQITTACIREPFNTRFVAAQPRPPRNAPAAHPRPPNPRRGSRARAGSSYGGGQIKRWCEMTFPIRAPSTTSAAMTHHWVCKRPDTAKYIISDRFISPPSLPALSEKSKRLICPYALTDVQKSSHSKMRTSERMASMPATLSLGGTPK